MNISHSAGLISKTKDQCYAEGYIRGARDEQCFSRGELAAEHVVQLIYTTFDLVLITGILPGDGQAKTLRVFFKLRGLPSTFDKLLYDAAYDLKRAMEAMPALPSTEQIVDFAEGQRLASIALQLSDGIANLMDEKRQQHDNGETLLAVMQEYDREKVEYLRTALSNAIKFAGREKGVDDVTRAIGEYARDHIEDWGRKWTLIGKRQLAHLESLEHPTETDRKVIAKYRVGGYLDREGVWHGRDNYLLDTVRDAYDAVVGK